MEAADVAVHDQRHRDGDERRPARPGRGAGPRHQPVPPGRPDDVGGSEHDQRRPSPRPTPRRRPGRSRDALRQPSHHASGQDVRGQRQRATPRRPSRRSRRSASPTRPRPRTSPGRSGSVIPTTTFTMTGTAHGRRRRQLDQLLVPRRAEPLPPGRRLRRRRPTTRSAGSPDVVGATERDVVVRGDPAVRGHVDGCRRPRSTPPVSPTCAARPSPGSSAPPRSRRPSRSPRRR